jgi:diguanylate cyclase (GGDEF)-like protein
MAEQGRLELPAARQAQAARWAARLYAAAGALALLSLLGPAEGGRNAAAVAALAVGDLVLATLIARRPSDRWDRRALSVVAAAGLTMIFLFALAGGIASFGHPTFFLLLFAWIGTALPPGSAMRFAAPAGVAYVVPLIARHAPAELVASVVVAVPVMTLIGELTAAVIGRLDDLNAKLADAARRDELTGVGNRRRADELLRGLARGDGVIMIDVDHFKQVNDHEGHAAGDRVLAELGSLLRRSVRGEDLVARYGGDEILVIAPSAGDLAARVAARITAAWRATPGVPTLSLGVAVHEPNDSAEDTLQRADAAVYAAKRAGGDRIHIAPRQAPRPRRQPGAGPQTAVSWS